MSAEGIADDLSAIGRGLRAIGLAALAIGTFWAWVPVVCWLRLRDARQSGRVRR